MAEVDYLEVPDGPIEVGAYNGSARYIFGAYRVQLDDGFIYLSPHAGFAGSVSEAPIPLDHAPFRALLVATAEALREQNEANEVAGAEPGSQETAPECSQDVPNSKP